MPAKSFAEYRANIEKKKKDEEIKYTGQNGSATSFAEYRAKVDMSSGSINKDVESLNTALDMMSSWQDAETMAQNKNNLSSMVSRLNAAKSYVSRSNNGSKENEDYIKNLDSLTNTYTQILNSFDDRASYYSQFKDKDEYDSFVKAQEYSKKYEGKSYAEIMQEADEDEKKWANDNKYYLMSFDELNAEKSRLENKKEKYKKENGGKVLNTLAQVFGSKNMDGSANTEAAMDFYDKAHGTDEYEHEIELINQIITAKEIEKRIEPLDSNTLKLLDDYNNAKASSKGDYFNQIGQAFAGGGSYSETSSQIQSASHGTQNTIFIELQKTVNPETGKNFTAEEIQNLAELREIQQNADYQAEQDKKIKAYTDKHPVLGSAAARGASLFGGITGTIETGYQGLERLAGERSRIDTNNPMYSPTKAANTIDSEIKQNYDLKVGNVDLFDFGYSIATSTADNVLRAVVGGGSAGAGALMATQVFTQGVIDGKEKGYSDSKAITNAIVSAAIEGITEKVSMEQILKPENSKNLVTHIIKSFLAEGSEEVASNVLNRAYDSLVNGQYSEFNQLVEKYKTEGETDSQALIQAILDTVGDDLEAFLIGGFSGGLMGGGVGAVNKISNAASEHSLNRSYAKELTSGDAVYNALAKMNASPELYSKYSGALENVNSKSDSDKKASRADKKALNKAAMKVAKDMRTNIDNDNIKVRSEAITKSLKEAGATDAQIKAAAELSNGKNLSNDEVKLLKSIDENVLSAAIEKGNAASELNISKKMVEASKSAKAKENIEIGDYKTDKGQISPVMLDSEARKIIKFDDVNSGTVTLDNGKKVNAHDLELTEGSAIILEGVISLSQKYALQSDDATVLLGFANEAIGSGADLYDTVYAADDAMRLGLLGLSNAQKALDNSYFIKLVSNIKQANDIVQKAFEIGNNASQTVKKSDSQISNAVSNKGHIGFDRSVSQRGLKSYSRGQRTEAGIIERLVREKVISNKIILFDSKNAEKGSALEGANGVFRSSDGSIWVDINAEQGLLGALSHELTHMVELLDNKTYTQIAEILAEKYGEKLFKDKGLGIEDMVSAYQRIYEEKGQALTPKEAYSEFVADCMTQMLADTDAIETITKLRRVMNEPTQNKFIGKIRKAISEIKTYLKNISASEKNLVKDISAVTMQLDCLQNIADLWAKGVANSMNEFERLTKPEKNGQKNNTDTKDGVKYSIKTFADGKKYVKADRQVFSGNDSKKWGRQVTNYINDTIRNGKDVTVYAQDGDALTITRDTAGKAAFRNDVRQKDGTKRPMTDEEYAVKLRAESHIDEISQVSRRGNKDVPDTKRHSFAKDGFNYRSAYFLDNDGKYYRLTLSVGKNGVINTVYNVGKIKEEGEYSLSGSKPVTDKSATMRSPSSIDSISNSTENVNNKSQEKFSLKSIPNNRVLLANALETVTQNDIERKYIRDYKAQIGMLEEQQEKLKKINEEIGILSFAPGKRDTARLKELIEERIKTQNRINIYDKKLLRLEATKPLQNVINAEVSKFKNRLAAERQNEIESRYKTGKRHQIRQNFDYLSSLLISPKKQRNIGIKYQQTVKDLLLSIEPDTSIAGYRGENGRQQLQEQIRLLKKSEVSASNEAIDEIVADAIEKTKKLCQSKDFKELSLDELNTVYDTFRMVRKAITNERKLFVEGKQATVDRWGDAVRREIKQSAKIKDKRIDYKIKGFAYEMLKPEYAFRYIGSDTFTRLFKEARKGDDTMAVDMYEANTFCESMVEKYKADKWNFDEVFHFDEIDLTLGEIMTLFAHSQREQSHLHLLGGIVTPQALKGKKKLGIKIGKDTERVQLSAVHVDPDMLARFVSKLTTEQIDFVKEMQNYLSEIMGAKGNIISRALYDIDLFKEKYYFPIKSAKEYLNRDMKVNQTTHSLKSSGMTKETVIDARNPMVIEGFLDVWADHVVKMSMYHSYVLGIENLVKVYNFTDYLDNDIDLIDNETEISSVKTYIKGAYGEEMERYIEKFLVDLNGGRKGDTAIPWKLVGNFKKTAVSASLSTAIQQPTAIVRAMAYVNPTYFAHQTTPTPSKHKATWEELKKYAPVAILKEIGGFDIGSGRGQANYLKNNFDKSIMEKLDDTTMWLATKGDEIGWNMIWNAVKAETKSKNPQLYGEELLKKAGERFTEVVALTQVYDSTFLRSGIMRSGSELNKLATAFMGEPMTSLNMYVDAFVQKRRGKISKAQKVRTYTAVIISSILASALAALPYAGRDDDKDKSFTEKYVEQFSAKLADELNPINLIPYVRDFWSILSGDDVERADLSQIKSIKKAFENLDNDSRSSYRKFEDLIGSFSSLFGIPLKNVMREGRSLYNTVAAIFDDNIPQGDELLKAFLGIEENMKEVNELYEKGKSDKAKETISGIIDDKVKNDGKTEKEAKSAVRSSMTAYWKEKYLKAYKKNDTAEMAKIRKILYDSGVYGSGNDVVKTCQNWVKSLLKKEDEEQD